MLVCAQKIEREPVVLCVLVSGTEAGENMQHVLHALRCVCLCAVIHVCCV